VARPFTAQLLSNVATDENGPWVQWPGGIATFEAFGTFGGATITLQVLGTDGVTALSVGSGTAVTANSVVNNLPLPAGAYRAVVSAGSGMSGLYAALRMAND
jgi:hypothetical protein